jgi:hypothetical protein
MRVDPCAWVGGVEGPDQMTNDAAAQIMHMASDNARISDLASRWPGRRARVGAEPR